MREKALDYLVCPKCKEGFALSEETRSEDELMSGKITCNKCAQTYPIINGVPRFVPASNYADSFGYQWNIFRQTQLDSYSGTTITRDRFLKSTGWDTKDIVGKTVLDIGCGSGRFTEVALSLGMEVFALDFSNAVEACWQNLHQHPQVHVIQADMYDLPFRRESFEYIYCLGVLQHTPDPHSALQALPPYLQPGGQIAVDFYQHSLANSLHPKYFLRPFTKRLPKEKLFGLVEKSVPLLLPVSRLASRVPIFGKALSRLIPVANYEGIYPLNEKQLHEWAILDTFDMLSPRYDQPQTPQSLRQWLEEAGINEIQVAKVGHLVGRGYKHSAAT